MSQKRTTRIWSRHDIFPAQILPHRDRTTDEPETCDVWLPIDTVSLTDKGSRIPHEHKALSTGPTSASSFQASSQHYKASSVALHGTVCLDKFKRENRHSSFVGTRTGARQRCGDCKGTKTERRQPPFARGFEPPLTVSIGGVSDRVLSSSVGVTLQCWARNALKTHPAHHPED
ncbi:hypothetical protein FA95DRAFT_865030 [Auriscalpium vulgare]|uniref:Uncharacterized protein n=1 Tax=Auriscalpium vulgare TaxID=40419 RepID=A0ACB8R8K8_9AGAM|nr:hypothetical protein FA95DRAFT_865030 [Auriscalpium vulgare]